MKKSSLKLNVFSSFIFGILLFFMTTISAFAESNIVSSVMIANSGDDADSYELEIDSTQNASYKTKMLEDGGIIFELRNSILSKNPSTFYDDVEGIESVVVKQYGKNTVRIFIQGENAQNTQLVYVNSIFEQNKNQKSVIINGPISRYQPTNHNDLDIEGENQDWNDNSFNLSHLLSAIFANLKDGAMGVVLIFALIFITILAVIKTIAKNYTKEFSQPMIGLNNILEEHKDVPAAYSQNILKLNSSNLKQNTRKNTISVSKLGSDFDSDFDNLQSVSTRSETIKQAQKELERAHLKYQQYLKEKYGSNPLKKVNVDAVKKGIALNQYQKSNKNPYQNQEVIKMNEALSSFQIPPRPKKEAVNKDFTSPYIQRKTNKIEYHPNPKTSNSPIKSDNSMKFLESVTKIYEQSGRKDLAAGLKNSINKTKTKQII